jgi:hypothetical protein
VIAGRRLGLALAAAAVVVAAGYTEAAIGRLVRDCAEGLEG